jgi:hypothetical protein
MTANTPTQKANQAHIMATTGQKVTDQVSSFDRFLAMVTGTLCEHSARNGHITPEAAIRCGQAMAEAELASQPATVDIEARLASVAITVVTQPRFQCSKGCPFGHKTQTQAESCSQGSQARQARQVRASIPVTQAVSLASLKAQQATQEATQAAPEASQSLEARMTNPEAILAAAAKMEATQPKASQPKASQPKARLRSGSQGATSKA